MKIECQQSVEYGLDVFDILIIIINMEETLSRKNKNPRVVKYRKKRYANVGVVIFLAIFIYFLIYTAMFVTRDKISVYEVIYGKTAESANKYYEGLVLRDETVNLAPSSGYLNCFVGEGNKVAVGSAVYTIDENGNSPLADIDDIIYRRMCGRHIKQLALALLRDPSDGMPSGFVGCVRYDYEKIDLHELSECGHELENIYATNEKLINNIEAN